MSKMEIRRTSTGAVWAISKAATYPGPCATIFPWAAITALSPLPAGLPSGRIHQGIVHRHRAAQRRGMHRLPVLRLELLLRRAAIQSRARSRGQVRHVQRPLDGRCSPACVNACPEAAIRIEIVNVAQWRADLSSAANAPGLPSASDSLSTTRITLPPVLPRDATKATPIAYGRSIRIGRWW